MAWLSYKHKHKICKLIHVKKNMRVKKLQCTKALSNAARFEVKARLHIQSNACFKLYLTPDQIKLKYFAWIRNEMSLYSLRATVTNWKVVYRVLFQVSLL